MIRKSIVISVKYRGKGSNITISGPGKPVVREKALIEQPSLIALLKKIGY
jgi:hypothetical protein